MDKKIKILYLEDNPTDVEYIKAILSSEKLDYELSHVSNRDEFILMLTNNNDFDIILGDYSLPGFDGFSALQISKQLKPDLPFVLISGELGEELAVESLKKGASDYVMKHKICRLAPAITRALKEAEIL
jgi:CheY-like chemotaxis protein